MPKVYEEKPGLFAAEMRHEGQRVRKRSTNKAVVERWAKLCELLGRPPAEGEGEVVKHTVGSVCMEALRSRGEWKVSLDTSLKQRMNEVRAFFGEGRPITSITTARVYEFVRHLEGTHSGRYGGRLSTKTVNRYLSVISGVLDYARDCDYISVAVKLPWAEEVRVRRLILTHDEEVMVLTRLAPRHALVLRVLISTPIRPGKEFFLLPADCIEDRWLRVWVTKNKEPRMVPIDPTLSRALRALFEGAERPTHAEFYEAFKEACAACGLPDKLTPYSLRHTVGTRLARELPGNLVQHGMGHKDWRTTQHYIHFDDADMKRVADVLRPKLREVRQAT